MFWACGALFRADAKKRHSASWGRELRAGEGLRLAGFSSGRRACARGDCPARRCSSVAACCTWIVSVIAVLLQRFAFGSRRLCGSLEMSCVRFTPVFFPLSGKKRRLAMSCVSIPPGRDRHSCVLAVLARLSALVGSLRNCAFICGDLDGVTTGVGYTKRNAVFVQRSFCYRFMIRNDTAGSPLGLRAPNLRQRVFDSLDSLHWIRGVGTFYAVRASVNPWL